MNNFDISQYLVEPEFAAWLREHGFDGECDRYIFIKSGREYRPETPVKNSVLSTLECTIPTFQQAFDFIEKKWKIGNIEENKHGDPSIGFQIGYTIYNKNGRTSINTGFYKSKREAKINACNAIKDYISKQQAE